VVKTRTSWRRGVSGNPNGRPHVLRELRDAAREHGPRCIEILAEMAGIDGPGAANEAVRLGAARELLDRGYGRPMLPIAGDDEAPPAKIVFQWAPATQPEPVIDAAAAIIDDTRPNTNVPLVLAWQAPENC
jgi:hypothetical protein